jgi:hypothetical protein
LACNDRELNDGPLRCVPSSFGPCRLQPARQTASRGRQTGRTGRAGLCRQIEPGEWRTTITISDFNAPGLPPGMAKQMAAAGPTVVTDCVTSADVAEFGRKAVSVNEKCTRNDVTFAGGRIAGEMVCTEGGGSVKSTYAGTYNATRMDMAASVESDMGGAGKMTSKVAIVSERLGACKS